MKKIIVLMVALLGLVNVSVALAAPLTLSPIFNTGEPVKILSVLEEASHNFTEIGLSVNANHQDITTLMTTVSVPGPIGPQGPQGITGPKGDAGADSTVAGPPGATGSKGDKGDKGDAGADSTVAGPPGATGSKGDKGDKGDTGANADLTTTNALQAQITALKIIVDSQAALLANFSLTSISDPNSTATYPTVLISGANLQIVNGLGNIAATTNGTGNLIVG